MVRELCVCVCNAIGWAVTFFYAIAVLFTDRIDK